MVAKKGPQEKVEARSTLTAVLLADSFTQRFRPITVERPKALLPLVNIPMVEYTLEWLAMNKVEEVFLFCCAHSDQIREYLKETKWHNSKEMRVTLVTSTSCLSAGEAMRHLDQKDIIKSDFILVNADTVSNMNLAPALEAHKKRRQADKNAIMTMVMKPIKHPSQRLRLGDTDLVVTVDPQNGRLLKYYEFDNDKPPSSVKVDASLFSERDGVQVRSDLMDTHIAICAPEVLMLFSDNFDYQNIKRDFVTGVLSEEELGNKLFIYEISREYAARVHNLRSYDAISRDLLQRWCFPFVPDTGVLCYPLGKGWGASSYRYNRGQKYLETGVTLSRNAVVGEDVCLGAGTLVGDHSRISQSVIGRDVRIGRNCDILGSYIQDNVVIQDGVVLRCCLVCEGATLRAGAVVEAGSIISYSVVVGQRHSLGPNTRLSLCQQLQNMGTMSDDELEYNKATATGPRSPRLAERTASGGAGPSPSESVDDFDEDLMGTSLEKPSMSALQAAAARASGRPLTAEEAEVQFDEGAVGPGGAGYAWKATDGFNVQRFSTAPPRCREDGTASETEGEEATGTGETRKRESVRGEVDSTDESSSEEEEEDPERVWKREVEETVLRCIKLKFDPNNVVIELNGLKIAEDRTFADCARYMLTTLLSLCLPAPTRKNDEYITLFASGILNPSTGEGKVALLKAFKGHLAVWKELLQRFLRSEDDQVDVLLTLEEFCSCEGVFEADGPGGKAFAELFPQLLKELYDSDVVSEEAILAWADEKAHDEPEERLYLDKARVFVDWLRTAEETEEEEDDEDDEDDEDE